MDGRRTSDRRNTRASQNAPHVPAEGGPSLPGGGRNRSPGNDENRGRRLATGPRQSRGSLSPGRDENLRRYCSCDPPGRNALSQGDDANDGGSSSLGNPGDQGNNEHERNRQSESQERCASYGLYLPSNQTRMRSPQTRMRSPLPGFSSLQQASATAAPSVRDSRTHGQPHMAPTIPNNAPIGTGGVSRFVAINAVTRRESLVNRLRNLNSEITGGGALPRLRPTTAEQRARYAGREPPMAFTIPSQAPPPSPLYEYIQGDPEDNVREPDDVLVRRMVDDLESGRPPSRNHTQHDLWMWNRFRSESVRLEIGLETDFSPPVSLWLGGIIMDWVRRELAQRRRG